MVFDDADDALPRCVHLEVGEAHVADRRGERLGRRVVLDPVDAPVLGVGEVHDTAVRAHRGAAVLVHPGASGEGRRDQVGDRARRGRGRSRSVPASVGRPSIQ